MLVFDIPTMGDLLDRALIADGVPVGMIDSENILRCAIEKTFDIANSHRVGAEVLFISFSDFCSDVGEVLGFDTSDDDFCLDWTEDNYDHFCEQCAQYQAVVAREMAEMHRNLVPEYFAMAMTFFNSSELASLKLGPDCRLLH